jgi:hypothetical protein
MALDLDRMCLHDTLVASPETLGLVGSERIEAQGHMMVSTSLACTPGG